MERKKKKSNFTKEKPDNFDLKLDDQGLASTVMSPIDSIDSWYIVMRMVLYLLYGLPP